MVLGSPTGWASHATALALVVTALGGASCRPSEGKSFDCRCSFLTDRDDPASQTLVVCASSEAEAPERARGCSHSGGPGTVQSCTCAPAASARACHVGTCQVEEP